MSEHAGEKNLEPTPHRRAQARREGHVAKSRDLGSAALLLIGLTALLMLGGGLVGFLVQYCREQLGGQPWLTVDPSFVVDQWNSTLWRLSRYLLPILGLLCLSGVAVHVLQVGFLFLPQRLAVDFERLNPLQGFQRLFSSAEIVRLCFGIFKMAIVVIVAGVVLYNQRAAIMQLANLPSEAIGARMSGILIWTAIKVGIALLVLSLLDYAYQWWRHEQDLKMTPQELREELKNLEGNPQVIARRKQMQRDLVLQRFPSVHASPETHDAPKPRSAPLFRPSQPE